MQHRIEKPGPLLDAMGRLSEPGYATSPLLTYNRGDIKANALRIKEWDYYLILCDAFAVALTIADNGYMGLSSISFLNFDTLWQHTESQMSLMPRGKTGLSSTSGEGDVSVEGKGYRISFAHEKGGRTLRFAKERFGKAGALEGQIHLTEAPEDSIVIATPFAEKPTAFYYNQKINCMRAEGEVRLDGRAHRFDPAHAFGTLDWGRGVWTYRNTWYWASCSARIKGVPFGMNLGYGFGDTRAATENMLFWDGKAHKLAEVRFDIPQTNNRDDYMRPWRIISGDERLRLDFMPVMDRASKMSAGIIASDQHQVFGRFTGKVVLDDGMPLQLEGLMGFAEKVMNKW